MPKTHAVAIYGTAKYKQLKTITYTRRTPYHPERLQTITYHRKVYVERERRITLWGSPRDIAKAKAKIDKENWIPKKKYVDRVPAKDFLKNPQKYAKEGKWIDKKIKKTP